MNLRAVIVAASLMGIFLLFMACENKNTEALKAAEKARQDAEAGLQHVKERDKLAKEIIQQKLNAGARSDSRFEGYATSDNDAEYEEELDAEEGTLKGVVAVWGSEPGTIGSTEGMMVVLNGEDDSYSEMVDSENWYTISAPPGEYTLVIDELGYKYFEKKVKVVSGSQRLVAPIGLQNE